MAFPAQDLEGLTKRLGRTGLLLSGVSVILLALGSYVVVAYNASQGSYNSAPSYAIESLLATVVGFFFLLLMGAFMVSIGAGMERGAVSLRGVFLSGLMFSLFLMSAGAALLVDYSAKPAISAALRNAGIACVVSGVLLTVGFSTYRRWSATAKITGVVFCIVAVALITDVSSGYLSALGAQASVAVYVPHFGLAGTGPADVGGLTGMPAVISYIIAGIAAIIYAFIHESKFVEVFYVAVAVGFVVFGAGAVTSNLTFLSGPIWESSGTVLAVASVNIVASVLFFIAGFLIIAASAVGMVYFSRQLVPTPPMPPSQAQPAKAQQAAAAAQPVGEFCPKCGNRTSPDDVFCRKCGAKLT